MKSLEGFRNTFHYDPRTGDIFWKVRRGPVKAGTRITNRWPSNGYGRIRFDGREYPAHRVAWLLYYGQWPKGQIDHINRDRADNRIVNLRVATASENSCNRDRPRRWMKGVTFIRSIGKFQAQIKKDGRSRYLGVYPTEREAHEAYCAAAHLIHGEFARVI